MSRARDLSKLGNPNVIKADENSVGFGTQVAGNPANPDSSLISAGIVSATAFYGDGSNLDGVASAGLGTALSEIEFNPLTVIYQTSDTLSINQTVTVDPPNSTSNVAYTQYSEVKLEDGADLIIADGDDFIPDILGLSTEGSGGSGSTYGNGVFGTIYADNIERSDGRGAPHFPQGANVAGVLTAISGSFSGNISIGGTLTYEDVTNVDSIGIVTARSGIDSPTNLVLRTGGNEKVRIDSSGNVLVGTTDTTLWSNTSGAGINLRGGQVIDIARSGDLQLTLNRMTNEGANIGLYQAGAIKGTIGTKSDRIYLGSADGTERLSIASAGQLGIGGANYGTSGQVLTSGGASAAPQWADASSALTRIVGGTVSSSVSSIDMGTSIFSSTYQFYTLRVWLQGTSNIIPQLQLYIGGAWKTSDYSIQYYYSQGGGIQNCNGVQANKTGVNIGDLHGTGFPFNRKRYEWTANFCNMHSTDYAKTINVEFDTYADNLDADHTIGRISGGWNGSNAAVTGMRINTWNSGANFTSGAWVIHGYN